LNQIRIFFAHERAQSSNLGLSHLQLIFRPTLINCTINQFAMALQASSQCVVSRKPASDKCGSCKAHVYCGKECQTMDWPKHKHICKDIQLEKSLERAAAIIQPAYLNFRENTWDTPIVKIDDKEDALVTYDGAQLSKKNYFVGFPHKFVKNERAKIAVLCTGTSDEPLGWMHNIILGLLQGQT
jgi:hypothetical protein